MIKTTSLALFALTFCVACAFAQVTAQPQTVSQNGLPGGDQLSVVNATPWFCNVSVGMKTDKKTRARLFDSIDPNETATTAGKKDAWWKGMVPFTTPSVMQYSRSSDVDIPVVALFYADAGRTKYIGVGTSVFRLAGMGLSAISSVVFSPENVRLADDVNPVDVSSPIATKRGFSMKALDVSYTAGEGMGIQEFIWNSAVDAQITTTSRKGIDRFLVQKGYVYYLGGRTQVEVTVVAKDADGRMRTWSQGFQNSDYYGTHAQIFILGMSDLH